MPETRLNRLVVPPVWASRAFAIALIGFGALQIIYMKALAGRPPAWPAFLGGEHAFAAITALLYIGTGFAIVVGRPAQRGLIATAAVILVWAGARSIGAELVEPSVGVLLTSIGKAFTLGTGALLVAHQLQRFDKQQHPPMSGVISLGARSCRFAVGAFLIIGGSQHFRYLEFVAQLIPAVFPARTSLAILAGVALLATGAGLLFRTSLQLSATVAAYMVGFWVFALHLPRAISARSSDNEWTAFFEAIAVSSLLFLIAHDAIERDAIERDAIGHRSIEGDTNAHAAQPPLP